MKILRKLILATFSVCLIIIITPINAQTLYKLWIAGKQVSSENKGDITAAIANPITASGSISYDDATKTLILNTATILTSEGIYGIHSKIENLTIKLIGNNLISAMRTAICLDSTHTTIEGEPTANLQASSIKGSAIYHPMCNLTITGGCMVTINGAEWGVGGTDGQVETLTISGGSTLKVTGTKYGSITDIKLLNLENDAIITTPSGAYFNATKKSVVYSNGNIVKEEVIITKPVGIDNILLSDAAIYPNPASEYFTINSEDPINNIGIVTTLGQEVLSQAVNANNANINVGYLSRGVYVVRAYTNSGVIVKTLSIIK